MLIILSVATVFAAGVAFSMLVVVVVTFCIRIIIEVSADIGDHCLVSTTLYPAEKFNSCLSQSILSSAADTAADKYVNTVFLEQTR